MAVIGCWFLNIEIKYSVQLAILKLRSNGDVGPPLSLSIL